MSLCSDMTASSLGLLACCSCILYVFCVPQQTFTKEDQKMMELSAFYCDCAAFKDPIMFGGEVCGSDGKTYPNILYLACINHWSPESKRVNVTYRGPCMLETPKYPYCPVYKPCCGSDNKTYANYEKLLCKNMNNQDGGPNITMLHEGVCEADIIEYRPSTRDCIYSPVCCTNGRTYNNIDVLRKLKKHGSAMDVLHDGGCTFDEVKKHMTTRVEICDNARNTYEWNPVCGNDNVTYPNPYVMMANKPNVRFQYMGECFSPRHQACVIADQIDKKEEQSPCVVCGSDGLTYTSIYHLECAKNQDKYLYWLHDHSCRREDNPCMALSRLDDSGNPLCGSDGTTYVNCYALWCVQRRQDPHLQFFHDGVCLTKCKDCFWS